jgi:predicted RNA-binding protein associated with RNAse of E/G family
MIFDPSDAIRFPPGRSIVRRNVYPNGYISAVESARVVSDDEWGLLTWTASGSDAAFRTTLTGESVRKMPLAQRLSIPTMLTPDHWRGTSFLALTPIGAAHSVWWFFDADLAFTGWYVNLEAPAKRWYGGIDCRDHALDIWVEPDRTWRWKDEDEFAERTGVANFWTEEQAAQIRAEGEGVIAVIEAGLHPFDGVHTGFRPDAAWEPTRFGPEWDLPRPTLTRR